MGTTILRKLLQSLCCNSCWDYAVFWKLQHHSQMRLTWEDGYCDIPRKRDSVENIFDNICFKGSDEMSSSNSELSSYDVTLGGNMVDLAVTYLSSVQYALGEGVVGEVAYTGNHRWIFSESISCAQFKALVPESPDEWLFQFAAGIKTILLVPVVPHGVLQLGSLEKVAEDLSMVAFIKDEFAAHQNLVGYSESFTVNREFLTQSSSLLISALMQNFDELSSLAMNKMKSEDSMAIDKVQPTISKFEITAPCHLGESTHVSVVDMTTVSNSSSEDDLSAQLGLIRVPEPLHRPMDFSNYRCLEEGLPAFSYSSNSNMGVFGEYPNKPLASEGLMNDALEDKDTDSMGHGHLGPLLSFPRDCELHKALVPSFTGNTSDYIWDSSIFGEDVYSFSSVTFNDDVTYGTRSSARETDGGLANRDDDEHFLEPVVSKIQVDDNSYSKTNGINSCTPSSGQFAALPKTQNQTERSALGEESTFLLNHATSSNVRRSNNLVANSSPSATSYESVISELIEEEQKNRHGYLHQRKSSKLSGASKRRGKPGDKQKPRPRDRQLIQDRLKELRELVPNGGKCSIDGLLDRTIGHMLFLRSVSDRADKLKQWVHPEGTGRKNMKSPECKGGSQNGTSWAFELGGDQQICPIIVEDLEYPGHMIIEMICDENRRFLEIAEVIHGLDLTILKGMMERRAGNTWAHFVIEAPRGLHRLDIFWPLMKLLQQNTTPISSKI